MAKCPSVKLFVVAWAITCCKISMWKSWVHTGCCISKERKQEGAGGLRGSLMVFLYPSPSSILSPLISPSTLCCLTRWWASYIFKRPIRVNDVKMSAARLGEAQKSSVKVGWITGCKFKIVLSLQFSKQGLKNPHYWSLVDFSLSTFLTTSNSSFT